MKLKSIRYGGAALVLMLAVAVLMAVGVVPAPGVGEKEFLVKSFSPQGQVTGRAEIKAVFNRAVVAADKVGISIRVRVFQGVAYTRLGGKMNNTIKLLSREKRGHTFPVS